MRTELIQDIKGIMVHKDLININLKCHSRMFKQPTRALMPNHRNIRVNIDRKL